MYFLSIARTASELGVFFLFFLSIVQTETWVLCTRTATHCCKSSRLPKNFPATVSSLAGTRQPLSVMRCVGDSVRTAPRPSAVSTCHSCLLQHSSLIIQLLNQLPSDEGLIQSIHCCIFAVVVFRTRQLSFFRFTLYFYQLSG